MCLPGAHVSREQVQGGYTCQGEASYERDLGGLLSSDVHIKERTAFRRNKTQAEAEISGLPQSKCQQRGTLWESERDSFLPLLSQHQLSACWLRLQQSQPPEKLRNAQGGVDVWVLWGNSSTPGCWPLSILATLPGFLGRPASGRRPFPDTFVT